MAKLIFPTLIKFLIHSCFILLSLAEKTHVDKHAQNFHSIHVSSLFPNHHSVCKPFSGSRKGPSTMEVIHRYSPCSALTQDKATAEPSMSEILSHDESRVRSIQAQLRRRANTDQVGDNKADLPTQSGHTFQTGNYVVRIGLGTPKQSLSLVFDTGSSLTWTQCQPCAGSCYQQQEPIFNPSSSSSYANISCNSPQCSQLASANNGRTLCSGASCAYVVEYMDQSDSAGFFAKETLTLTPNDVLPNFQFGCGQHNTGLFGKTAGLLGLGRDPQSLISQTAQKYNQYFSYCLPSSSSSTGHLTFGKGSSGSPTNVQFTPLATSQEGGFYFLNIIGISVGGRQLPIDQSVFKASGNIIDSGTVITRLHPAAFSNMSRAFQQMMTKYPRAAQASSLLDICYDFSNFSANVTIPRVAFIFAGNVKVDFESSGILIGVGAKTACLAFAPNEDAGDAGIIGNRQQSTFEVVYDVAGGKVGFGAGGCN